MFIIFAFTEMASIWYHAYSKYSDILREIDILSRETTPLNSFKLPSEKSSLKRTNLSDNGFTLKGKKKKTCSHW